MLDIVRPWLPPRLADLPIRSQDLHIYSDNDGGRTIYYSWYRWAASMVKPKVVAEIGVRLGYSARALAFPDRLETYLGFDNQCYIPNSNEFARIYLEGIYPETLFHSLDTQTIDSFAPYFQGKVADIFHVDGDHTYEACLHDLELTREVTHPGSLVIVDDASLEKPPGKACADFIQKYPDYAVMTLNDPFSLMGHFFMLRVK